MDLNDYANDLLAGLLYGLVGLGLMAAGCAALDMLIPGKVGELIMKHRRRDVGLVVAAGIVAIGTIVTAAIAASDGDLGEGLAETAGFGVVGIILLVIAFVLVDRLTPGRLGEILGDEHEDQPAAFVTSASLLAVGAIIAAALS